MKLSTKEAIIEMKGEILRAIGLGYNLEHIAAHLRGTGFEIADSTFKNYWREVNRKPSRASPAKSQPRKKPKEATATSSKTKAARKKSQPPQKPERSKKRKGRGFVVHEDTKDI